MWWQLRPTGDSRGGEKKSDYLYTSKVELTVFADRLDVTEEKERCLNT